MSRLIAGSLVILVVGLALSLAACGGDDPYTGTWRAPADEGMTWVIAKANDGWWSVSQGGSKPLYAAELHGQLETGNAGLVFKRSGDKLTLIMLDVPVELTKQ